MTYDDLKALCEKRRSIRYFDSTPLTFAEIEPLLALAQLAPSVENIQPWHFHVIFNQEMRSELMKCCCYGNFVAGAGALLIVTCDTKAQLRAPGVLWQLSDLEYSCVTAMEHVLLGATTVGLGSCWVTLRHAPTRQILKLTEEHQVIGGIMLGHVKRGEESPSGKHERLPLAETYTLYE